MAGLCKHACVRMCVVGDVHGGERPTPLAQCGRLRPSLTCRPHTCAHVPSPLQHDNMVSNAELRNKYASVEEAEDDFM